MIDDFRKGKAQHIANGMAKTEAMHLAADEAVNDLKHRTRQRRRIERDQLLGVGRTASTVSRQRQADPCPLAPDREEAVSGEKMGN